MMESPTTPPSRRPYCCESCEQIEAERIEAAKRIAERRAERLRRRLQDSGYLKYQDWRYRR